MMVIFLLHFRTYCELLLAVTLGAGIQWGEAFDFVEKHGRFIVGGSPSVGAAGGWVMGGGHGPLSPSYGLGTLPSFISFILRTNKEITT
jgi:FAD binding domain